MGANLQAPNFGFGRLSIHAVCTTRWEPGALIFIAAAQRSGEKSALSHRLTTSKHQSHPELSSVPRRAARAEAAAEPGAHGLELLSPQITVGLRPATKPQPAVAMFVSQTQPCFMASPALAW